MKVLIRAMKLLDKAKDSYDIELIAAATGHVASLLRLKSSGVAKKGFHESFNIFIYLKFKNKS